MSPTEYAFKAAKLLEDIEYRAEWTGVGITTEEKQQVREYLKQASSNIHKLVKKKI